MLDIVMVNYKTPHLVDEFIQYYEKAHIQIPHTLTVVDVETQGKLDVPGNVIYIPTNVGYGRACNDAACFTYGEVIAFFNSDVRIYPQSVEKCVEILLSDPSYGVVGPLQIGEGDRITHAGIFGTLAAPKHRDWQARVTPRNRLTEEAVTVSGSAYFTTRDLWDELQDCKLYRSVCPETVGAFLETKHYYEETWYSYHAQAHGKKIMYCGEAMMYHGFHKSAPMGVPEKHAAESRATFRRACEVHSLPHD